MLHIARIFINSKFEEIRDICGLKISIAYDNVFVKNSKKHSQKLKDFVCLEPLPSSILAQSEHNNYDYKY